MSNHPVSVSAIESDGTGDDMLVSASAISPQYMDDIATRIIAAPRKHRRPVFVDQFGDENGMVSDDGYNGRP